MKHFRSLILALVLIGGFAPAIAQVPAPVPALPDAERRTTYTISGSICACGIGFQLYGDAADYQNWLQVYVNGVLIAPSNWTLTSPSGSLAALPRPISDAIITFTSAQTGTVNIVGARRPRRVSQFSENRGVAARDINQVITDLTATERERWDQINRALQVPPGETLGLLPAQSVRANTTLAFDSNGNPIASPSATQGPQGPPGAAGCLTNARVAKTSNYTVLPGDAGSTIALSGNTFFTLTFSASGYPAATCIQIVNEDAWGAGRAKWIVVNGFATFYLWPTQTAYLFVQNGNWQVTKSPRVRIPNGATNLYSDWTNGSDTTGATDCLAPGAGACRSAEKAFLIAAEQFDLSAIAQSQVVINMAANTLDTQGVHAPVHGITGAQGGAAVQFVGASLAISALANNGGGLCRITVPSTATYSNNQVVSTYGIATTTTCNGTFKVTVIDGTHLDLQASTFSAGTGGTVTNGSGFNTTGVDGMAFYFGTVVQLQNLYIASDKNGVNFLWGSKGYLLEGNIFGGSSIGANIAANGNGQIEIDGSIGIASAGFAVLFTANGGNFYAGAPININILAGLNPAFTQFVLSSVGGRANFASVTINLNGNTVTGTRCAASALGLIVSPTGLPNTYFPGNANCTISGGGQAI